MPQVYRFDKKSDRYVAKSDDTAEGIAFSSSYLAFCALGLAVIGGTMAFAFFKSLPAPEPVKPAPADPLAAGLPNPTAFEPTLGKIKLGAFSGEAADLCGFTGQSIASLSKPQRYRLYRKMVRQVYGADLEDMNYFSVGTLGWSRTIPALREWLLMAGQFGDVTVALEPMGFYQYDGFENGPPMRDLRKVFLEAKERGITVWVRYASEANLQRNPYSAGISAKHARLYYEKARWLKNFMPSNVKLVFSPLVNTVIKGKRTQFRIVRRMFYGGNKRDGKLPWDRIGGTIYRTDMPLERTYNEYYKFMSALAPDLPFQICELGGPYSRRSEMERFLRSLADGKWPKVKKVNLFARDINKRADPNGSFGYLEPAQRMAAVGKARERRAPVPVDSWLKPLLTSRR